MDFWNFSHYLFQFECFNRYTRFHKLHCKMYVPLIGIRIRINGIWIRIRIQKAKYQLKVIVSLRATNSNYLIPWNLVVKTFDIWSKRFHSLKYLRSTTLGCKDKGIRKSDSISLQKLAILHQFFFLNILNKDKSK